MAEQFITVTFPDGTTYTVLCAEDSPSVTAEATRKLVERHLKGDMQ